MSRIETIQSYQVVQVADRFDIIGPDKDILVSFDVKNKKVNFRRDLRFFNDDGNLFASLAQNNLNPNVLDLFSLVGLDVQAPFIKFDTFDSNQGDIIGIGPDGLLVAVPYGAQQMAVDTVLQNIPAMTETPINISLVTNEERDNPEILLDIVVEDSANSDFELVVRYYLGGVLQTAFPIFNILKGEMFTVPVSFIIPGTVPDATAITFTVEANKSFDIHESILKIIK